MSTFYDETKAFHQDRIRVLKLDIEHLERVVYAHTKTARDPETAADERAYARTSAIRSRKALDGKRELLAEYMRGAANFIIAFQPRQKSHNKQEASNG